MEAQIAQLYTPVLSFIKKRVNDSHDAEDLTQEVFLKLAKSDIEKINSIKSWVYTIARNSITDYYRKKKIPVEAITDYDLSGEEATDNVAKELSCCLFQYIDMLPDDYKEIMSLSEIENLSQKEIAERLDLNYVTVRSKVQRGRKRIKELVEQCCTVVQGGRGSIMSYRQNVTDSCGTDTEKNSCS